MRPHIGDEHSILQYQPAAKLVKHPEIPSGGFGEPIVENAVGVDGPGPAGGLKPFPTSVESPVWTVDKQKTSKSDIDDCGFLGQKCTLNLCVGGNPGVTVGRCVSGGCTMG